MPLSYAPVTDHPATAPAAQERYASPDKLFPSAVRRRDRCPQSAAVEAAKVALAGFQWPAWDASVNGLDTSLCALVAGSAHCFLAASFSRLPVGIFNADFIFAFSAGLRETPLHTSTYECTRPINKRLSRIGEPTCKEAKKTNV